MFVSELSKSTLQLCKYASFLNSNSTLPKLSKTLNKWQNLLKHHVVKLVDRWQNALVPKQVETLLIAGGKLARDTNTSQLDPNLRHHPVVANDWQNKNIN